MHYGRWSTVARLAPPLGHFVLLVAFVLPWAAGDFGARDSLTGLDLARVAGGATRMDAGPWSALSRPAELVLLAVPVLAANALLLHALAAVSRPVRSGARHAARWLAGVEALAVLVVAGMLLAAPDAVAVRPGTGLLLAMAACALALLPALLQGPARHRVVASTFDDARTPST